jgi:glycosyltransferase involved in cell wall biosynthesis
MSPDTVSCIVPAYNAERFLLPALESIFRQTYPALEVIVVDDGSTDGTAALVRHVGDRVKLVEADHRGSRAARDAGLAVAQGAFVAFLDADDIWVPEKTKRQLDVLRQKPEIDLCVAHYQNFWDPEIADEEDQYRDHPFSQPLSGYIIPTLLASRNAFDRFGGFDSGGTPSDTAWFARAVAMGAKLETLSDVLLHRRLHRTNDSRVTPSSVEGLFHLIKARRHGRT